MLLWSDTRELKNQIAKLQADIDDYAESQQYLRQARDDAESKMRAMQRRENMEGIKAVGDETALLIDDIYARGMASVANRRNAVSLNIQAAIRKLLTGVTP